MLSATSRPVIEATLPVIAAHIEDITPVFYGKMFAARPDLLEGTFSRANQKNGTQPQALAGSIARFATWLLENPDTMPEELLARIAHKHTSLNVRADEYPTVHEHLFAAIVEVLGDAVTPEVAAAWDEVYWLMADALIKMEKGLYEGLSADVGYTPWRIAEITEETESVKTFRLEPADDSVATPGRPGQYVSVRLTTEDGLLQARQFSLSCSPESTEKRVITVKRDQDGEISPVMHSRLAVGDVIEVSPPFGLNALPSDDGRPLAFITAGIGITVTSAALCSLKRAEDSRSILAVHADKSFSTVARLEPVKQAIEALPNARAEWFLREETGADHRTDKVNLAELGVTPETHVFLCGPMAFMQAMREQALEIGVAPQDIHYDAFGPDIWMPAPGNPVQ
ncbi:globin domain-containing protein [Falsarthrobacter nasiphocae]|uniref:nitric oxide dioxygenase n=1 Tax=Falsarthrobacter nasiphocae TaxID=189863 RepID=A0AAE3YHC7_9MICC|nr:globin domain-containing protein [Falsarthrobacter nasiphocae]MDR6891796.1 nitric oxide dioxygenase [Falsarthrobacter nasiphocae]